MPRKTTTNDPKAINLIPEDTYRLIEVRATNFKRLKAVSIKPDRSLFTITGRNEQGKSSLLDAVAAAIGGKDKFPSTPIRAGENEAVIDLNFGGLRLVRTLTKRDDGGVNHAVKITFADGSRAPKEKQHVLDVLRGSDIADDPLEFARMKPQDRFNLIKRLVDFDFDEMAKKRQELFERRTQVGRDVNRAKAAAEGIDVAPDAPRDVLDVSTLAREHQEAVAFNASLRSRQANREAAEARVAEIQDRIDILTAEMNELQAKLSKAEKFPPPKDAEAIARKIETAEEHNAVARKVIERETKIAERDKYSAEYDLLSEAIDDMDDAKDVAIKKAKLPVDNLTFGDNDIMVDGLPFESASTARKIRIATALLMALKPQLRVLLVREGSLLDDDARAALEADAEIHDFVVLMETVGEDVSAGGVVIEDGMVVK